MSKFTRKARPADDWYIEEHECWFSDMSLQGLHIQKLGRQFAKFEKGEPRRLAYRIALTSEKEIDLAQVASYEEYGWTYVTSQQYSHVFVAEEGQAREVQMDTDTQLHVLKQLQKKLTPSLTVMLITILLFFSLTAALWFSSGTPILQIVKGQAVSQTFLGFIFLLNTVPPVQAILQIRQLQQKVWVGSARQEAADWKRRWKISRARTMMAMIFAVFVVGVSSLQLIKMDYGSIRATEIDVPFIQLSDFEQEGQLAYEEQLTDGEDWFNYYSTNWGLFAPVQYEVSEYGIIKALASELENSVSIETEIYHLRFQALAAPLLSDLTKWHSYEGQENTFNLQQSAYFDELLVRDEFDRKEVLASKGHIVLYARYDGEVEMDAFVDSAERVMGEALVQE